MTSENVKLAVHTIVNAYDESVIYEMIDERKHEYIDDDDVADFNGDFEMAYDERGRSAAEYDILNQVISEIQSQIPLNSEEREEVWETLVEIWNIYIG